MKATLRYSIGSVLVIILLGTSAVCAQTAEEIGQVFQNYSSLIFSTFSNDDSLKLLNAELLQYLKKNLPRAPESLSTNYSESNGWGTIATSADKQLRIWGWDDGSGGPMSGSPRTEISVAEFRTPNGIQTQLLTSSEEYHRCDTIFLVKDRSGKTFYLPLFVDGGGGSCRRNIEAYAIEGSILNTNVPLFNAPKSKLSSIVIEFQCGNTWEEHNFRVVDDGHTIFVPLINRKGNMTRKDLRYEFDGKAFIYTGVTK